MENILLFLHLSSKASKVKSSMTFRELTRNDKNAVSWLKMLVKLRSIFLLFNFPKIFLIIQHICLYFEISCVVLTQNKLCVGYLCHHESFLYICQIAFSTLTFSMKALEQDNFNLNQLQLLALTSLHGISL